MKAPRVLLVALATLRLTRFVTTDWLGEWTVVGPIKRWAVPHEEKARRALYDTQRAEIAPQPMPPYAHWAPSDGDGSPRSWQGKLTKGLDCPFCVGFWIGALLLLGEVVTRRWRPLRAVWTFALGALGLNYAVGHVSSRLDG